MATKLLSQILLPADPGTALEAATKQYVDANSGVASREELEFTTASIGAGGQTTGTIALGKGYRLYTIETSAACRTRLYTTTAKRSADLTREIGIDPEGDHGLILEFISSTDPSLLSADLSPLVDGFDGDLDGAIPYAVDNLSGSTRTFTITFSYIQTE